MKHAEIRSFIIEEVIRTQLPAEMLTADTEFLINPTGRFVVGGPQGDTGLTGRKIIVDTYGGMGRHGGGAFSGKDPSKVDRSAAYMGRYVAKNIVAAGLARRCEVQFAYAIGHPRPVSVHIDTFGTNTVSEEKIEKRGAGSLFLQAGGYRDAARSACGPSMRKTTNYGHFGKEDPDITWERTDKVDCAESRGRTRLAGNLPTWNSLTKKYHAYHHHSLHQRRTSKSPISPWPIGAGKN